jgi:hypothetical protein
MTDVKGETDRELTIEEMEAAIGAAQLWQNPGVIRGFNPQPDPPGMPAAVLQLSL